MNLFDDDRTADREPDGADGETGITRRHLIRGGAAAGVVAAVAVASPVEVSATPTGPTSLRGGSRIRHGHRNPSLAFEAVAINEDDAVTVPGGYLAQVINPWGDPIEPGGPAFRFDARNTAADQARQFGMGHDGMALFEISRSRGLMVTNHEAIDAESILFPSAPDYSDTETVRKAQNAHGVSVAEIALRGGSWRTIRSRFARRITANTPMEITGPAAGHPLMRTSADPSGRRSLGTVNNCGDGRTPWRTYLTCEENFNRYFGTTAGGFTPTELMERYGVGEGDNPWWLGDPRFDLAENPNEPNRFGWIVEIDPFDRDAAPRKRTALGRLKHENAAFAEGRRGQAVVYTGDDERFQHLYKFVSRHAWRRGDWRRHPMRTSPLDDGILYVARFDDDGTGEWVPLVPGSVPGYASLAEILIDTRGAAAAVGATPMDRPEWIAVHPDQPGIAYGTFTNNTRRTEADAANPRANNRSGHIIRWHNDDGDHAATSFTWSMFALAGAGLGSGDGSTIPPGDAFGSPDGLAFDPDGRLWIQTDGSQPMPCNNQMLAADPLSGDIRRFLVGPKGAE
ncbi:MAG: PhoX family phosphatase, partial [Acidimicrobiia bacterium]|nr:PhoX family phosphatase [Acidimicrobiia bacterium]